MECPRCRNPMTFDWSIGTMRCGRCDYELFQEEARQIRQQLDGGSRQTAENPRPASAAPAAHPGNPPNPVEAPGGMDLNALPESLSDFERGRMRGRLEAAMFALARHDADGARRALLSALEISEDYPDAWLQLAALAPDADEQRRCLKNALASDPTNLVARQALAMLDGRLDTAEPPPGQRLEPGQAASLRLACPQCGGRLAYDEGGKAVFCAFCGYRVLDADELARSDHHSPVFEGILRRKYQGKRWNVGQQWLRCGECGAITTLPRHTLTITCRFCGSRHVIQESAQDRFEQPDLIAPFALDEPAARAAIDEKLSSGLRRITRFFADAVDRIDLHGAYLPFWVFDADMIVNWSWSNAPDRGKHPILLSDITVLAVPSPPRELVDRIEPYDLQQSVDYDPRLLATHPARLYSMDMTEASIQVRSKLVRLAERRAETGLRLRRPASGYSNDDAGSLRLNAYTEFLTYRLALLPVWIARLVEEDGDTRTALVNGQTGQVALGGMEEAGSP